jgi:hypothetical protein
LAASFICGCAALVARAICPVSTPRSRTPSHGQRARGLGGPAVKRPLTAPKPDASLSALANKKSGEVTMASQSENQRPRSASRDPYTEAILTNPRFKAATGSNATIREKLTKKISENPKWREAPPSGKGFVIGGAKPTK